MDSQQEKIQAEIFIEQHRVLLLSRNPEHMFHSNDCHYLAQLFGPCYSITSFATVLVVLFVCRFLQVVAEKGLADSPFTLGQIKLETLRTHGACIPYNVTQGNFSSVVTGFTIQGDVTQLLFAILSTVMLVPPYEYSLGRFRTMFIYTSGVILGQLMHVILCYSDRSCSDRAVYGSYIGTSVLFGSAIYYLLLNWYSLNAFVRVKEIYVITVLFTALLYFSCAVNFDGVSGSSMLSATLGGLFTSAGTYQKKFRQKAVILSVIFSLAMVMTLFIVYLFNPAVAK